MNFLSLSCRASLVIGLCGPVFADTVYSGLQDTAIPTDFTGVFITVDGGTVNPFFGGVGVANNNLFQPVRSGTGNLDTIQNLAVGSTIDVSRSFSSGYGGSQDHLGSTFASGQEGYLGFKTGNGNYGWMRVVFTANTSGAVVKDWAYDNSGSAIVVGRVHQSSPSAGTQLVTLSPDTGESFTLGSAIVNTGGNVNSVLKTGAGTTTVTNASYTGTTTVDAGQLVLADTVNVTSNAAINAGTLTVNGTLDGAVAVHHGATLNGHGTVGAVTVSSGGTLAAGNTPGELSTGAAVLASGSIFAWELNANVDSVTGTRGTDYDGLNASSLDVASGAIFRILLTGDASLDADFWASDRTWSDIFNVASTTQWANGTELFDELQVYAGGAEVNPDYGYFSFSGSSLTWTAVPEPASALAGLLLGAGLLRRNRPGKCRPMKHHAAR